MRWWCRLGLHRWTLWPEVLRQEANEPAHYCARCGRQPTVV